MKNKMEKAQRVTLEGTTINDYHIDPDWEITLKPGEEKTVIVEWPIEKFDYNGVDVGGVKIIDLQMLSYEAEKPDSIIWGYTDLVTIDDSKPYTYTDLEGCPMVLENPDLEIAVLGFEKRADGFAVKVHSENVGESLLDVKMTEAKIDGIPCDGTFAFTVSRGRPISRISSSRAKRSRLRGSKTSKNSSGPSPWRTNMTRLSRLRRHSRATSRSLPSRPNNRTSSNVSKTKNRGLDPGFLMVERA